MQELIIQIMNDFGYLGIAFLIAVENIFPPIPSEIILTFGGFMTTYSNITVWGVILSATIGSVLGAIVLYGVGRILSAEHLGRILDGRIGKILHFKKEDVFKACDWFNSKGKITVLICRCVPIVRSLISIPAGMSKMSFRTFLPFTTLGSFAWNIVLVYLGAAAGASWERIVEGTDMYKTITIIALAIIFAIAMIWFIRYQRKNR